MITEQDLQAAIAECKGQRNPTASTCIKLAAFLTIQEHLFGTKEEILHYSYAAAPSGIQYESDSEFASIVNGKSTDEIMKVFDELMQTIQIINPKLYASVLRKLE